MHRLTNISLSNIRRFGENVNIPIQQGATIFLAPNGTGKTSLFEAIELALTGKVNRLTESSLNAMIREGERKAFVNLEFDKGLFCNVSLDIGQMPFVTGNHNELFNSQVFENLPYLLRLTHLLDQQNSNWLVQFKGDKAGSQLEHLAIGREAIKADSVMTSAKRASTERIQSALRAYESIAKTYSDWNTLLEKKRSTKLIKNEKLIPLNELLDKLNDIAITNTNIEAETIVEISNIISLGAKVREALRNLEESLNLKLNKLIILDGNIDVINSLKNNHKSTTTSLDLLTKEISSIHEEITIQQKSVISELDTVAKLQEELYLKEERKRQFDLNQTTAKENEILSETLKSKSRELLKLRNELSDLVLKITSSKSTHNKRMILESQSLDLDKKFTILNNKRNAFSTWAELIKNTNDISKELDVQKKITIKLIKEKSFLTEALENQQSLLTEIRNAFNSIISSQDNIREAVILISSNLSDDFSFCPVCSTEFESKELKKRINNSISRIDPNIVSIKDSIKKAEGLVDTLSNDERLKQSQIDKSVSLENLMRASIERYNSEINTSVVQSFPNCASLDMALELIEFESKNLESEKEVLENEKKQLTSNDGIQVITAMELQSQKIDLGIKSLEVEISDIKNRIDYNSKGIESFKALNIEEDVISKASIDTLKNKIQALKNSVEKTKSVNNISQQKLNSLINEIGARNKELSLLDIQIKTIRTAWDELKLYEIDESKRLTEVAKVRNLISDIFKVNEELTHIAGELHSWKENEKYFEVEKEIVQILAGKAESDYSQELFKMQQKAFETLESLRAKNNILQTFGDKLSKELNFIHEKVKSINPYWQKLLKRIVVDPRFYETELNSFSKSRKQHATINVNLHGESTMVRNIASEAQLTDLQLTFMMSMATRYQWSSWKGLLLDDPIQHHDLVHASGVFDLLRDYIIDFDYQLIMATHDESQARYFMRKLVNDGVPAKLCILKPTKQGVDVYQE